MKCKYCKSEIPSQENVSEKYKKKFCNKSCAASYNNSKYPKRVKKIKTIKCHGCDTETSNPKYCNKSCESLFNLKKLRNKFKLGLLHFRSQIYRVLKEDNNSCTICGLSSWQDKPIRLWVDHIDGDASNNMPYNLRLICPNCESQADTSRGKNYGNGRTTRGMKPYS